MRHVKCYRAIALKIYFSKHNIGNFLILYKGIISYSGIGSVFYVIYKQITKFLFDSKWKKIFLSKLKDITPMKIQQQISRSFWN